VGTDTGSSQLVVQVTENESADWLADCRSAVADVEPEMDARTTDSTEQSRRKVGLENGYVVQARKA
jgi:hypothetical protein